MKNDMRKGSKILAVSLSVLIAASVLPMQAFAVDSISEAPPAVETEIEEKAETQETQVLSEDTSRREENVKHFRLSDGTIQAAQYGMPVHFQKDGQWVDYDNTLTEVDAEEEENRGKIIKNKDLVNTLADYTVRLSKKTNGKKFVRIDKDGYKLSWYYLDAKKSTAEVTELTDDGDMTTLEKLSSRVVYEDVYKDIDFEYLVTPEGLKENIILKDIGAQSVFTAEYKANGLTPVLIDNKNIELRSPDGTAIYTISAPYMTDANGETSTDVTLSISNIKNNTFTVMLTLNAEWLSAENRVFPVTVDPYLETSQKWTDNTVSHSAYIASSTPNAKYGRGGSSYEGSLYVGNTLGRGKTRALIKNPTLPTLGVADTVVHAELAVYVYECYPELRIDLHRVTSAWDQSTVCWNSNVQYDNKIIDYQNVQYMEADTPNKVRWQQFEITDLVRGWYSGEYANNGVLLRSDKETSSSQARAWMFSSGYTTILEARPMLLIHYRNMSGYEDYGSYTSLDAGRNGVASVNNYNGNLIFSQPVTQDDGGNLMPVNLSAVYNSNGMNAPYSYMAKNVQTNYHMYLREESGQLKENGYRYYFNDSDGTRHWFYFEKNNTTQGKDEDGLGLTLDVISVGSDSVCKTAKYRITDKDKNKMYFNAQGNLEQITNANGISSTVQYETVNNTLRIKSITDGAGRVYKFEYHPSNYALITSITDPAGRKTSFEYYLGVWSKVNFPDGKTCNLFYQNNDLTQITGVDGTCVNISYDSSRQKRVTKISWGTSDTNLLERYSFAYKQNETTITDQQSRSYTYQFNDLGQNTGIVSNTDGTAQFFEVEKGNQPGNNRANKLLSSSKVLNSVTNYVVNPGFTRAFSDGYSLYAPDKTGSPYAVIDTSKSNVTNNSLKVYKPSATTGNVMAVQEVGKLPAGVYTLSAYANTNGSELAGTGAYLGIELWGQSGLQSTYRAENIIKTTGWERYSITFEVKENQTVKLVAGFDSYGVNSYGTVWFDDIQLEKSASMSSYNLVENSGLTNGKTSWSDSAVLTSGAPVGFTNSLMRYGSPDDRWCGIYQKMPVSGKKNDVYSFGAWVKADSAPTNNGTKLSPYNTLSFSLSLHFYDQNGTWKGNKNIPFNCDVDTWQFISAEMIMPQDYYAIGIEIIYFNNVNTVSTVGAFCYKEQFGQTYDYDKDGNVVSVVDLAQTNSTFAYKGNQMAKMLNPSGSQYVYAYAYNESDLSEAFSTDGQRYSFTYDDKGNVLTAKIEEDKPITDLAEIKAGGKYIIRNEESGNVIDNGDNKGTVYNWRYRTANTNQIWILESAGEPNVYYFKTNSYGGLYMGVKNNSNTDNADLITAKTPSGNAFKFQITSNGDGTFRINTKASNYTKGLDGQPNSGKNYEDASPLKQWTRLSNDKSQHWLFYEDITAASGAQQQEHIYTSTSYTPSKNFVSTSTDQRGKVTTYNYNEQKGTLDSVTDARGNTTSYIYDNNTNALTSVASGGMKIGYTYDKDRLKNINVNNGLQYQFEYDGFGRTTANKVGNGTTWRTLSTMEYNSQNLLAKQVYGNGNYVTFSYDALDRITETKYNDDSGKRVTYSYGSDGSVAQITDYYTNTNTRFVYDLADRVVSQREFAGTGKNGGALRSYTDYTYADKTSYLTGVKHFSPLGTQNIGYRYGEMAKGEMPDQIYGVTWNGSEKVKYTYDGLGRLTNKHVGAVDNSYTYEDVTGTRTTTLVRSVKTAAGTYTYTYDEIGNIKSISDGTYTVTYDYDNLNQLVRSNDEKAGKTYTYSYVNGNITERKEYAYTTGELGEVLDTKTWQYGDSVWGDLLTNYNGTAITYDTIGNPLTMGSRQFSWMGRQLTQITDGENEIAYAYNGDGQRVSKTVNGTTTEYFYNGGILAGQKTGEDVIVYMYDNNGDLFGFIYNGAEYFYVKNAQNDVIAIVNSNGTVIANYYYDDWGKLVETTGDTAIANLNPIRYRSYYFDTETGWYYLNTRYYSPDLCRFINTDGYVQTGQDILDKNMFAYCGNNPINRFDENGLFWKEIGNWFKNAWNSVKTWASNTFGAGVTTVQQSRVETEHSPVVANLFVTVKTGTRSSKTLTSKGNSSKPISVYAQGRSDNPALSSVGVKFNLVDLSLNISLGLDNIGITGSIKNGDTTNSFAVTADISQFKIGAEASSTIQWDENYSASSYTNASITLTGIIAAYCFATTGQVVPAFQPQYG